MADGAPHPAARRALREPAPVCARPRRRLRPHERRCPSYRFAGRISDRAKAALRAPLFPPVRRLELLLLSMKRRGIARGPLREGGQEMKGRAAGRGCKAAALAGAALAWQPKRPCPKRDRRDRSISGRKFRPFIDFFTPASYTEWAEKQVFPRPQKESETMDGKPRSPLGGFNPLGGNIHPRVGVSRGLLSIVRLC